MSLIDQIKESFSKSVKDPLISQGMKQVLKPYFEKFGTLEACSINTNEKSLDLSLSLKGESSPVRIRINRYEITETNGKTCFIIRDASTSKAWMTEALNTFVVNKPILEIPREYKWIIEKLV